MTIFKEGDLSEFLKDFGETAILEGGDEVNVIFDNEYVAAALLGQEVATSQPMATGLTTDLENVSAGNTIEIRGITYTVSEPPHPDGTGMTVLILKR